LLKTKAKVQFERPVIRLSMPLFRVESISKSISSVSARAVELESHPLEGAPRVPEGYHLPYVAKEDVPYWLYKFGHGPRANNSAGIIRKGGLIHVQGPAGSMGGTHQSGYLMGVGRIIVRVGDFQPAPALPSNS
jgi:hypothetical protein